MNPYLMNGVSFGPSIVHRLLERIPETKWDERPDEGRFTVREAVAHLADWEPVGLERLQLGVRAPGSVCEVFDESKRAIENDYASKDAREEARKWGLHRQATVAFLAGLAPDDWSKSFVHPERGVLSVYDQANLLLGHDLYHIDHLTLFLGEG